jgi:DNA-binding transcriptional ArsR family regulator
VPRGSLIQANPPRLPTRSGAGSWNGCPTGSGNGEATTGLGVSNHPCLGLEGAGGGRRCRVGRTAVPGIVSAMANDPFQALAHPLRRGIVERLAHGPTTIGEATRDFGVSKPTISRHVRVLEDAGVIVRTVDGRKHRLSLDLDTLGEAVDWIDRQRAIWNRMFDVVDDYLEEQKEAR